MTTLHINEKEIKGHINPEIYGHFSVFVLSCTAGVLSIAGFTVK